jgi:hypothetical protein
VGGYAPLSGLSSFRHGANTYWQPPIVKDLVMSITSRCQYRIDAGLGRSIGRRPSASGRMPDARPVFTRVDVSNAEASISLPFRSDAWLL